MSIRFIENNTPFYEPDKWNFIATGVPTPYDILKQDNCYNYAVSGTRILKDPAYSDPGQVHGDLIISFGTNSGLYIREPAKYANDLIALSVQDGLTLAGKRGDASLLPPHKEGHYLVALYVTTNVKSPHDLDYHWIRRDAEGGWSEKIGELPVQKVRDVWVTREGTYDTHRLAPAYMHESDKDPTHKYQFVQYFYVPEQGIEVGFHATINQKVNEGQIRLAQQMNADFLSQLDPVASKPFIDPYLQSLTPAAQSALTHSTYQLANAYLNLSYEEGVKQYPELALAYQTESVLNLIAKRYTEDPVELDVHQKNIRQAIAESIHERGLIPTPTVDFISKTIMADAQIEANAR